MKKVIIMLVMVMMMVGLVAHAELRYSNFEVEEYTVIGKYGEEIVKKYYSVTQTTDAGDSTVLHVTEEEYERLEKIAKKQAQKDKAAERSVFANVGAFLTFWNPDD